MQRTSILHAAAAVAALLLAPTPARADTVILRDGRRIVGRTSEDKGELVIRQKLGEVRVKKGEVLRIEQGDDVWSEAERMKEKLGRGTAPERYELGVFCRERGLEDDARAAFRSVLDLDPDHPGARAALGYVRAGVSEGRGGQQPPPRSPPEGRGGQQPPPRSPPEGGAAPGRWITEDDRQRARGLVQLGTAFGARAKDWVEPAEKIRLEADAARRRTAELERTKLLEAEREAHARARAAVERDARNARIRAYDEELARARARQRAVDEAEGEGLSSYYGPVGPCGGLYGPYGPHVGALGWRATIGTSLSTNDLLIWSATRSGRWPYPTAARPFIPRTVWLSSPYADPGWRVGFYGGGYGSSSSWGAGVGLSGSYTSPNGGVRVRFRSGP